MSRGAFSTRPAAAHADANWFADVIAGQCSIRAPAPAVEAGGVVLTYAELGARCAGLAARLEDSPRGSEQRVGVCAGRSAALAVGVQGALTAGAACVPLDPDHPTARIEAIAADAQLDAVVVERDVDCPRLGDMPVIELDADGSVAGGAPALARHRPRHPESAAFVLYTSGSTGQPKGVVLPDRMVISIVDWYAGLFAPVGRVLQYASPGFDILISELFTAWRGGGTAVITSAAARADAGALLTELVEAGIEHLTLPVGVVKLLALEIDRRDAELPAMRDVVSTGEQAQVTDAVRRWFARHPAARLHNNYGPTETHVATSLTLGPDPWQWPALPSIGTDVGAARVQILDGDLRPTTVGQVGEVCVGGGAPARGYAGRPRLTAERFVPDPCSPAPGGRLYRTGDLARELPDGTLQYLGRNDRQVKIRGSRVELDEVEVAMAALPGVRDAAAVAAEAAPGERRLVAFVVADRPLEPEVIRQAVADRLPAFAVPSRVLELDALPRTSTGKVDRRTLEQRAAAPADVPTPAARHDGDTTGAAVREALMRALGRAPSHDDSLIEMGLDSLSAMAVAVDLRRSLGTEISAADVLSSQTAGALGRAVAGQAPATVPLAATAGDEADTEALSHEQQHLWFEDLALQPTPTYNVAVAVHLDGPLDVGALGRAVDDVVLRHHGLRQRFPARNGEPVAAPAASPRLVEERIDETALSEALAKAAGQPFRLEEEAPLRARLLTMGQGRHVLVLVVHHIATDADALNRLLAELAERYAAQRRGAGPVEPAAPSGYAAAQRSPAARAMLDRHMAFWRQALAGAPTELGLVFDRPIPRRRTGRGATVPVSVGSASVTRLRSVCVEQGATLFSGVLAAFGAVLARWTRREDIVVGTPVSARDHPGVQDAMEVLLTTTPLRLDLSGRPSFTALVDRARDATLGAMRHRAPLDRILTACGVERAPARPALVQALIVLEPPIARPAFDDLDVRVQRVDTDTAKFDLSVYLEEGPGGLTGRLEYDTDLFDEATASSIAAHLERVLGAATLEPERPVEELDLLSPAERELVLTAAGPMTEASTGTATLADVLGGAPDRVAIEWRRGALTYSELDRLAAAVAGRLTPHVREDEALVGVHVGRTAAMPVAVLGVLYAGAAYVPLDPSYPPARLTAIARRAGLRAIVAEEEFTERLEADGIPVIPLTAGGQLVGDGAAPAGEVRRRTSPDALAYVLHTSGSTGSPKGVAVPHRGVVEFVAWARSAFGDDTFAQSAFSTSLSFDVSVFELFTPLAAGGTVVIMENALELGELAGASFISTVPSAAAELARRSGAAFAGAHTVLGGEALSATVASAVAATGPASLWNLYGPTEATVYVTAARIEDASLPVTIGTPIAAATCYILDDRLELTPRGVPGELYLGGPGIARGYLGQPALSAERFVPDPFGRVPGARLYRTGDLCRLRRDGAIDFLGRMDDQIKVRGFRVEPGEIESALVQQPAIREAVVVARPGRDGIARLVAYLLVDGPEPDLADVRARLETVLAPYLMPSAFVVLDRWPRTVSGKINRGALPEPDAGTTSARRAATQTATEAAVAACWERVLGNQPSTPTQTFFDAGGHSLLMLRLRAEVGEALGVELSITDMFRHATVEGLARHLDGAASTRAPRTRRTAAARSRAVRLEGPEERR